MKHIICIVLLSGLCLGQAVTGTSGSGSPSGTSNVQPTFVSNSAASVVGAGTTLTITAPATITNGNALVIFMSISGAASETFTFPAGFSQIGSTLSSVGSAKIQVAAACKVAASESGNYVVSWNNNTNTAVGWMVNLSGTSCTTDGVGTASGNASTLTATTFTPTTANDIFLVLSSQSSSALNWVNVPGNVVKIAQSSDSFLGYLPWGTGVSPAVKMAYTLSGSANANDSGVFVIAFPATTTATNALVANSSSVAQRVNSINVTNGIDAGGSIKGSTFLIPNGASCTSTSSGLDGISAGGNIEKLLCINSAGALSLDAGGGLTFVSTAGGARGGPSFLISNGALAGVSIDASQDLPMADITSPGNDLVVGCKTGAPASLINCTSASQSGNIYVNVQTGLAEFFQVNDSTVFEVVGGGTIFTEAAGPTNVASSGSFWEDSTAHEWKSSTAGSSTPGLFARVQPGVIHQTAQTAAISTATLCASSAGACNVAGTYHVSFVFWEDGTACATPGTGGVTFLLTWTDFNTTSHPAVSLGMDDASAINAVSQTFHFQTSLAAAWASGDFNISTNGAIIQYATGYTACGVGTGSYGLDIAVTRVR